MYTFRTAGVPSRSVASPTNASVGSSYDRPTVIDHSRSSSATEPGRSRSHRPAPAPRALFRTAGGTVRGGVSSGCTRPGWTPATEPVIWLTGLEEEAVGAVDQDRLAGLGGGRPVGQEVEDLAGVALAVGQVRPV